MYATIRIYAEAEGLADAVAENRAEIVGLFREIDGFRAYYIVKTGPVSATSFEASAPAWSSQTVMEVALTGPVLTM